MDRASRASTDAAPIITEQLVDDLQRALAGRFMLAAELVFELLRQHRISELQLLTALIPAAAALARPLISSFKVGAVGLGNSGAVYIGVNLEFRGAQLNNSVHAEQSLLANAWWHGETGIQRLAVSAAPCGHCRQFYSEIDTADDIIFSFGEPSVEYSLQQLLPKRFGPADLLSGSGVPLLLQPQCNHVAFAAGSATDAVSAAATLECTYTGTASDGCKTDGDTTMLPLSGSSRASRTSRDGCRAPQGGQEMTSQLEAAAVAALRAANLAYCPYTRSPSGVTLLLDDGSLHWGGYLESAAFNPSLAPLQSALITAVRAGVPCYSQVTAAVLVEDPEALVQHAEATALLLSKISPNAKLIVIAAAITS